jgi:hypothetical protein
MNTRTIIVAAAGAFIAATAHAATSSDLRPVALAQAASINKTSTGERWEYQTKDGGVLWASTHGDLGALGQYCNASARACAWVLVLNNVACTKGEQHPVLVNTDQSASHNVIQCMGSLGGLGAAFAFVDFDRMDSAIRQGKLMGIAIPEQDDEIGVARFELAGAADVLDRMRQALRDGASEGAPAATEDGNGGADDEP